MIGPKADQAANVIATAAVASPVWLPWLDDVSKLAAMLLPILGCLWLVVQIAHRVLNRNR